MGDPDRKLRGVSVLCHGPLHRGSEFAEAPGEWIGREPMQEGARQNGQNHDRLQKRAGGEQPLLDDQKDEQDRGQATMRRRTGWSTTLSASLVVKPAPVNAERAWKRATSRPIPV